MSVVRYVVTPSIRLDGAAASSTQRMRRPIVISSVGRAARLSSFASQNASTPFHHDAAAGAPAVVNRAPGLTSGLAGDGRRSPRRLRDAGLPGAIAVTATAADTGGAVGS